MNLGNRQPARFLLKIPIRSGLHHDFPAQRFEGIGILPIKQPGQRRLLGNPQQHLLQQQHGAAMIQTAGNTLQRHHFQHQFPQLFRFKNFTKGFRSLQLKQSALNPSLYPRPAKTHVQMSADLARRSAVIECNPRISKKHMGTFTTILPAIADPQFATSTPVELYPVVLIKKTRTLPNGGISLLIVIDNLNIFKISYGKTSLKKRSKMTYFHQKRHTVPVLSVL